MDQSSSFSFRLPWSQRLSFILYWQILGREPLPLFFFFCWHEALRARLGASISASRRKFPNKKDDIKRKPLKGRVVLAINSTQLKLILTPVTLFYSCAVECLKVVMQIALPSHACMRVGRILVCDFVIARTPDPVIAVAYTTNMKGDRFPQ